MTQEQWKAIAAKDRKADGQFWYALQGGRTFCRPSCRTKSPRAEQILIFSSCQEAVRAGGIVRAESAGRIRWIGEGQGLKSLTERRITWKTICLKSFLFRPWPMHFIQTGAISSGSFMKRPGIRCSGFTGRSESEKPVKCWRIRMLR